MAGRDHKPNGCTKSSGNLQPICILNLFSNGFICRNLLMLVLCLYIYDLWLVSDNIIYVSLFCNSQSCRKLLELMRLDGYVKVREMMQTKFTGPPSLLNSLPKKQELISRKHLFANSKGLFTL